MYVNRLVHVHVYGCMHACERKVILKWAYACMGYNSHFAAALVP